MCSPWRSSHDRSAPATTASTTSFTVQPNAFFIDPVAAGMAILLPYVAVVLANAVRPRQQGSSAPVTPRGDGPGQIAP